MKNVEGRDFVAYLPNEDDPDNYDLGQFIIFDVEKFENENLKDYKTVQEWQSLASGINLSQDAAFENAELEYYDRRELPGAIFFGFDPGCLHAMALFGIDDHCQLLRILINNVSRKDRKAYKTIVRDLFDRVRVDRPVSLMKTMADPYYLNMKPTKKNIDQWVHDITEQLNRLDSAKSRSLNAVTSEFKNQQRTGNANVAKFKKSCEQILRRQVSGMEEILRDSFAAYAVLKAKNPAVSAFDSMKGYISSLTNLIDQSLNDANGEIIASVHSDFKNVVKRNIDKNPTAIKEVLKEYYKDSDNETLKAELGIAADPQKQYDKASALSDADDIDSLSKALDIFRKLDGFKDSKEKKKDISKRIKTLQTENDYSEAVMLSASEKASDQKEAVRLFSELRNYKDSKERMHSAEESAEAAEIREKYDRACELAESKKTSELQESLRLFRQLKEYKDSADRIEPLRKKIEKAAEKEALAEVRAVYRKAKTCMKRGTADDFEKAAELFREIADYKDAAELAEQAENERRILDEKDEINRKSEQYNLAMKLVSSDDVVLLNGAISRFTILGDFKDSKQQLKKVERKIQRIEKKKEEARQKEIYDNALNMAESDVPSVLAWAVEQLEQIPDYNDSQEQIARINERKEEILRQIEDKKEASYLAACAVVSSNTADLKALADARRELSELGSYKDSAEKHAECMHQIMNLQNYNEGLELLSSSNLTNLERAVNIFGRIENFRDSSEMKKKAAARKEEVKKQIEEKKELDYKNAMNLLTKENSTSHEVKTAQKEFKKLGSYKDSKQRTDECAAVIELLTKYETALENAGKNEISSLETAAWQFLGIKDFRDSEDKANECNLRIEKIKADEIAREKRKKFVSILKIIGFLILALVIFAAATMSK